MTPHTTQCFFEHKSYNPFGVLDLERACPKRRLRYGDVRSKITLKKVTAEVFEIKLVK